MENYQKGVNQEVAFYKRKNKLKAKQRRLQA